MSCLSSWGDYMKGTNKFKDYINRIFLRYAIVIIASIFILFLMSLYINFRATIVKTNRSYNNQLSSFLDGELTKHKMNINALADEPVIKEAIQDSAFLKDANTLLYESVNRPTIRCDFILVDNDYNIVTTNQFKGSNDYASISKSIKNLTYYLLNDPNKIYTTMNTINYNGIQESYLLIGKVITDEDGQTIGFLLFNIRKEDLRNHIRFKDVDIVVLTDRYDNIIYTTNELMQNSMGKLDIKKEENIMISFDNRNYYLLENYIQDDEIKIISMMSIDNHIQSLTIGITTFMGISIMIMVLVSWLSPKLVDRSLESLDALMSGVNQMKEGNLDYKIEDKTFDEFQTINDEFNSMTLQIQNLIRRNEEIAERKRLTEIKHLESQFNPHFIFNVLEMLRYEILFDPKQASEMVVIFANLMRYNINYGRVEVPLKTDIINMENYLRLQKMRYDERLRYNIMIDEALSEYKIPKLLFQPIVENSIKYGMENTNSLEISIEIKKVEDGISIKVEDNGPGIDVQKLKQIQDILEDENAEPNNIGIYNVHRTIKLLYGDEYGLRLKSGPRGTTVVLLIPIRGELNV